MSRGIQIIVDDAVITRRMENLYPSRYVAKLNGLTKEVAFKYGHEISSSVQSIIGRGNVIYGMHKRLRNGLRGGYISENYKARWLDEGTVDRWTKTKAKSKSYREKYRGKQVVSNGVFRSQVEYYEPRIYAGYRKEVTEVLINAWNRN